MAFLCGGSAEERCRLDMTSKQEAIISGEQIKNMLLGAYKSFEKNYQYINDLNVFPVPDGDTGTNMMHTMAAVAREISQLQNATVSEVGTMAARSAIMGARGNSGVILSQLLRGLGKGLAGKKRATSNEVGKAFQFGILYAYRAVSKPVEGTILTVARAIAKGAYHAVRQGEDFEDVLCEALESGKKELARTPELLPALKAAGVVDAGGQGLIVFLEGCLAGFRGEDAGELHLPPSKPSFANFIEMEVDLENPYCTEFIVMTKEEISMEEEQKFKDFLMGIGDSIVVVADEDIIKVHVHTNHPGKAIEKGLTYGELTNMKIDNMREEHRERLNLTQAEAQAEESKPEEPRKDFGFVAVSIGQGMNDIFRELGVDYLIEGGQTMNPSTEDMLNAIEQVNAETVFILPNNKNIILAATQAQSLVEDKNVVIIPTTTVPQGISAIIGFDPEADAEENEDNMKDIIECVKTGEVTYAVRDTSINGITIKVDDIMGIDDDGIKKVGQDIEKVTLGLLEEMVDEDSELISIYYGEDTTKEQAEALLEKVEETYGDCDVQLEYGGQPIYYFLLSVE